MKLTLDDLATDLLFGKLKTSNDLEERIEGQWQYRKGKDIEDVKSAIKKGLKLGSGKTEREIDGVALYLNDVFKKVRSSQQIAR